MAALPGRKAFFTTYLSSLWIQGLTLLSGMLVARMLGPEGRGQLAGAQVWPGILGMVALFGVNNILSIQAAEKKRPVSELETLGLVLALPTIALCIVAGWFLLPWVLPAGQPELIPLSRGYLLIVPIFAWTSTLMAIDQGAGNFRRFNQVRNILNPVYLGLVLVFWLVGVREVVWFLAALLFANFAVMVFRLAGARPARLTGPLPPQAAALWREGFPFWITGIVHVLRDNAERIVLMALLPAAALGFYVVAFTASGIHLNLGKSLNLVLFSRSAAQSQEKALLDVARLFRLMAVMNLVLGLCVAAALPLLIPLVFGAEFKPSVWPAMLLVVSQFFLSQGMLINEGLRARRKPFFGMLGMVLATGVFVLAGVMLAGRAGLLGVAAASVIGQACYCAYMMLRLKRACPEAALFPGAAEARSLAQGLRGLSRRGSGFPGAGNPG